VIQAIPAETTGGLALRVRTPRDYADKRLGAMAAGAKSIDASIILTFFGAIYSSIKHYKCRKPVALTKMPGF
jgi:hypothetical protein